MIDSYFSDPIFGLLEVNSFYEIEHPSGKKKKVSQESDKAFLQLKRNKNAFKISILPCAVSFKPLEKITFYSLYDFWDIACRICLNRDWVLLKPVSPVKIKTIMMLMREFVTITSRNNLIARSIARDEYDWCLLTRTIKIFWRMSQKQLPP